MVIVRKKGDKNDLNDALLELRTRIIMLLE